METLAASEDGSQSKPLGFGIKLLSEGEKYYCPTPRGPRIVVKKNLPRVQNFEQYTGLFILCGWRDGPRYRYTLTKGGVCCG